VTTVRKRAEREQIFAREYVIDLNGSRAAIAAGYSAKGADVRAAELLGNRRVKELIARLTKEKCEKLDISAEWILGELRKIAGYDAGAIFSDDGSLKPIKQWDSSVRTALVGLDHEKLFGRVGRGKAKHVGTLRKIKLADKLRALELLGKYRKLFTEKVEVTASDDLAALIAEGRKRAAQR